MRLGCLVAVGVVLAAGVARAESRPAARKQPTPLIVQALGAAPKPAPARKAAKPAPPKPVAKAVKKAKAPAKARQAHKASRPRASAQALAPQPEGPVLVLASPWTAPAPASHRVRVLGIDDTQTGRGVEDLVNTICSEPRVLDLVELLGAQGLQRPDPTWKGPVAPLAALRPDRAVFGVQGTF